MRIALVAPPYIAIPPKKYGGTELFIAELAIGLKEKGIDITLYTNGESTAPVDIRYMFEKEQWPLRTEMEATLRAMTHSSWAIKDAAGQFDLIHVNSAPSLSFSRFVDVPFVYTVHHDFQQEFADFYETFSDVSYVTISDFQRFKLPMPKMRTVHHGIDPSLYQVQEKKRQYLTFLGRVAPPKGTHLAIQIAKKSGIPLKIAGEIQPIYQEYWENEVKPHVDGKFIEYVGEVGLEEKNELLGNSLAMLFPIQWDEPFGLVLIESMACGTPVLAMPGGSVAEIIQEGVSGYVSPSVDELANCAKNLDLDPGVVRQYVEDNFSLNRMVNKYIQLYTEIIASDESEQEEERIVA